MNTYKLITLNNKPGIVYKIDGNEWTTEFFTGSIRPGYINEDRVKWAEMLNDLLQSGNILTKMRTATNMGAFFTIVLAVIQNGANGFPDEQGLQTLMRLAGWGFTNGEKALINTYFTNNNFSISVI